MYRPQNLRIPGPTFVPQTVLNASARPMINHRGHEFAALMAGLTRALQDFLNTEGDVFLLTASGSGGMEAALVNTLSSGDRVLLFVNGAFGERFAAICKAYGVEARRVDVPWGRAVEPEVVRESGKLLIVDSVSGAGAVELMVDEWGVDVLISASQKAWGAPPGIAMVTMSEKAWKAYDRSNLPKLYFDLQSYKAALEKGATPATPAVGVFIGLQESLRLMAEEGQAAIIKRHRDLAFATRRGLQALNLGLFGDERYASPCVTAFRMPTRVDPKNLIRILRDDYDTVIAGGQGRIEGQVARVGHMGFVTLQDLVAFFGALEQALKDLNQAVEPGQAISAVLRAHAETSAPPARTARGAARREPDTVAGRR